MIIQPFFFGNVDGDLATEFAELDNWTATFLGQPNALNDSNLSVLASVATAQINSDSRLFNDGYHLQTLLNSVDSSYPFTFFILGDTYGNAYSEARHGRGERNIQMSTSLGHNWLLDKKIKQASLLNILIQYATLKSTYAKHRDDSDSEGKPSPFIYLRRPTYERSVVLMTENGRFAHQRAPTVLADAIRMDSLKREILSNDLRMRFFNTSEELVKLILADIYRCIKMVTQDVQSVNSDVISTPTLKALTDELWQRIDFDNNDNCQDRGQSSSSLQDGPVQSGETGGDGKIVALIAEPRSGKHRLLYSWLAAFTETNPGIPVSVFHANADAPSFEMNSVVFLMDNAIRKFRTFYKEFDRTVVEGRVLECLEARQLQQTEQEFGASLALGPCLLVIMGLDFVSGGRYFGTGSEVKVKQLQWLPETLPPQCRVIVTTTSNDMTLKALLKRNDVDIMDVSKLSQDGVFKETFLRSQCVAYSKFPHHLITNILASPSSGSTVHLAAIGRILANQDMLHRLEFQVESILELTRLRDLFAHELRKWTGTTTSSPMSPTPQAEEPDRTNSWIPVFLRFMVLSRYGIPTRSILPIIRLVMGVKRQSHNQKVVERWWTFWQASNYLFTAGTRNTLKLISESVRRSLATALFDSNTNSFAVWRRRYVRFLQSLPNSAQDPVVIDELIIQADQADDFPALLRLISNAESFSRLVSSSHNMEVFALSLLFRIESNTNGLFRYLIARWLNALGVLCDGVVGVGGDSTDRSDVTSPQFNESDAIILPQGPVKRCDFAWLICDWLFSITRSAPNESDHNVTVNAFVNLIPMVVKFCENELGQVPFDAEAHARLAGFLMRCSARFAAPRFNNMKLAVEMMQQAAKICIQTDQELNAKSRLDMEEMTKSAQEDLNRFIEKIETPNAQQTFHKYIRYSFISAQLESCEMYFKLGDMEAARAAMSTVEPYIQSQGPPTWPPIICGHLFSLSLFSQSSTNSIEKFLRVAADVSTKWYGRKHPSVADTLLALGCILASRATTPKPERAMSAFSQIRVRPSTAAEGLQQVFDSLFTSDEVEQCFREAIAILEERRLSAGGDTERLSFACASLGRFLSNLPTSSAKREAVELLQKAGDLALLESGQEDYTVKWLRSLTKNTLLAMPPVWFTRLQNQQKAEDAARPPTRPFSSRPYSSRPFSSRRISATMYTPEETLNNNTRPITTRPMTTQTYRITNDSSTNNGSTTNNKPTTSNGYRSTSLKTRPKTSLGLMMNNE